MSDRRYLELEGLSIGYGDVVAVRQLDLAVPKSEFIALLGPSGCGKTTTMRAIAGLLEPRAGRIRLDGVDITRLAANRRQIGLVFQSYALFPHLTVYENVAFGLRLKGLGGAALDGKVADGLRSVGLDGLAARRIPELSGGQQQRVALARSMVMDPKLLMLDEPLSNLDAKLRVEARSFLAKMHHELGITTIYVTHDQAEAMTMGTQIIVMSGGEIQQAAPPLEVYNNPANRFVAGFIGSPATNFMTFRFVDDCLVDPALGIKIPVPEARRPVLAPYQGSEIVLGARPEHIRVTPRGQAPQVGAVKFTVDVAQHLGHEILLDIVAGPHRAVTRVAADDFSKEGEQRSFEFDLSAAYFFDPKTGANVARGGA